MFAQEKVLISEKRNRRSNLPCFGVWHGVDFWMISRMPKYEQR
jgi:hypothetical protein